MFTNINVKIDIFRAKKKMLSISNEVKKNEGTRENECAYRVRIMYSDLYPTF